MLALTIPSAVILAVGIRPLVQAAFGFEVADTELVVIATRAYLIGLAGHAMLEVAARSFYAQQDAKTPLFAAAINAFVYILLANLLAKYYGFTGIAVANSIAFTFEAILLLWLLNRRFPGILKTQGTLIRVLLVSAGVGTGLFFVLQLDILSTLNELMKAIAAAGGMLLGLLIVVPFILPEIRLLIGLGGREGSQN